MNIVIAGVGGQGAITLKRVLSFALVKEKMHFRMSELHGLSQRGGSVAVHVRYDTRPVYSPMVGKGTADLIIGLDLLEASRAVSFASKTSVFVTNDRFISFFQVPAYTNKEFRSVVTPVTKKVHVVEAAKTCKEKFGNTVFESMFLLGYAFGKGILSLSEDALILGIEKSVPEKYTKENIEAFRLGATAG